MNAGTFCPICKFKNDKDAEHCKYCGAPLGEFYHTTTVNIPKTGSSYTDWGIKPKILAYATPMDALAFFIKDEDEPLVIENAKDIYLGRLTKSPSRQLIDLEPYNALKLGVSRLHARIVKEYSSIFIEDLNSSNGTWVNDKRIRAGDKVPLNHLDTIQFGRLQITICFPPDHNGKTKPLQRFT
jgi:hypothetical protein